MRPPAPTALLAALALPGCSPSTAPQPTPISAEEISPRAQVASAAPTASTPGARALPDASSWITTPRPESLGELLADYAVDSRKPARRTLFSWTTEEQARELARTKTLLVKGAAESGFHTPFEQRLNSLGGMKVASQIKAMLTSPAFQKQRYAFANVIGWAVGVEGKPYGPVLSQINLRKEAILLSITGDLGSDLWPFQAQTVDGEPVPTEQFIKHPERVAAFFNEQQDARGLWFREYILFNEGMIESWSVGTDAIKAEIEKASAMLARLEKISPEEDHTPPSEFAGVWNGLADTSQIAPWGRAVGVASPAYVLTRNNVAAIRRRLTSATFPPALTHQPPEAKPRKLPPPPPPAPTPPQFSPVWAV